jgi:hypothetical protein
MLCVRGLKDPLRPQTVKEIEDVVQVYQGDIKLPHHRRSSHCILHTTEVKSHRSEISWARLHVFASSAFAIPHLQKTMLVCCYGCWLLSQDEKRDV